MTTTTCFQIDASIIPTKANLINSLNDLSAKITQLTLSGEIDLAKEIDSQLEQIKKSILQFFPLSVSYPVFSDLRLPELEWETIITGLQQEYHLYIQTMILDVISSLIPVNFEVSILGLNVDLLQAISNKSYVTELKLQIAQNVDQYYGAIPDSYKAFGGEYGVEFPTLKADAVWSYIKSELNNFALNLLHSKLAGLISTFSAIWTPLGLPALPSLTDLNIESLVQAKINSWENSIKNLDESLINKRNELYNQLLIDLNSISVVGFNPSTIIGGEIKQTVLIIEQEVNRIIEALRDFGEAYPKKLILEWMDVVMAFFNALGIGGLISNLLSMNFDSFLTNIVGFPTCITITDKSDNGN